MAKSPKDTITFKDVVVGFLRLPGTILSGISGLLLGKNKNEHGLFSLIFTGIIAAGRGISNAIKRNIDTIATAFWLSALMFGAAALTVFLWPAALTAIITFPVLGYTLAALITNPLFQILAIGGIAAAATSLATYTVAGIVNGITALVKACCPSKCCADDNTLEEKEEDEEDVIKSDFFYHTGSTTYMAQGLNVHQTGKQETRTTPERGEEDDLGVSAAQQPLVQPVHTDTTEAKNDTDADVNTDVDADNTVTTGMTA